MPPAAPLAMSTGRLTFLYPQLMRATAAAARRRRANSSFARRAGKAVEPMGWEPAEKEGVGPAKADIGKHYFEERQAEEKAAAETDTPGDSAGEQQQQQQQEQPQPQEPQQQQQQQQQQQPKALEAVYLVANPPAAAHTSPQRYVHHFDSYSLVKQLQEGGYTSDQAVTAMKAIRGLLARNLDVAQETLVSKSDVSNESYLFSAACSELRAEIAKNRRAQDEHTRQQRTHLQHEVDILTQSLNQELLTLNDFVRGLFNDRSMAVREKQKTAESAIQQINYKMSIMLGSESKSEIEGVRWILIRRAVVGILFMAMVTLGTIRYATYVSHERAKEAERRQRPDTMTLAL